ncbi:hypothetical protein IBTHAUMO2_590017 [Nitrosopumilaceae archaeon]|nr:hypothetical protein IBTHAUMO2_590017 [Nitrosopumilaceae archaeon]
MYLTGMDFMGFIKKYHKNFNNFGTGAARGQEGVYKPERQSRGDRGRQACVRPKKAPAQHQS